MKENDEIRIILTLNMSDIEEAIESQGFNGFFEEHPEVKAEAFERAHYRLTKYIDNYAHDIIAEAVYDTVSVGRLRYIRV